ncbi:MAG: hypothetical protein LBO00_04680 [Zoogloeaceae bacterium]|jgi:hypothetical protein|nr:hypothetical protein [Zoogloeaceae bacterium]
MDTWQWFDRFTDTLEEAGQGVSARLLFEFVDATANSRLEQAEALLPEVRALAKSLDNPWLEVFVGHWEMRHRLGNQYEGQSALHDMVAIFERAHRSDAIDCPQSVCVTQDFAECHSNIDAPGWAAECRAVLEETLQRIDPSWSCFACLSEEYAFTLYGEGQHAAALDWIDAQENALRQAGKESPDGLERCRCWNLAALGRAAEAEAILVALVAREDEDDPGRERRLLHAYILALLGRDAEAWEMLPAWDDLDPVNKTTWIDVAEALLPRAPERNTWQLGASLQAELDHLDRHGAYRPLVDYALVCARLALARGAGFSARRILALARKNQKRLRVDAGAAAQLEALERAIEACPSPAPPVAAEVLVAHLETREERNPEREAEWLLAAQSQLPDDMSLAQAAAAALRACGARSEAEDLLWCFVEAHPRIGETLPDAVLTELVDACLEHRQGERLESLARLYDAIEPPFALWCRARWANAQENWADVVDFAERGLAFSPDRESLLRLLAGALTRQKRFAEAAAVWLQLANRQEGPCDELWDHMSCAAAAGDWAAARQGAARQGISLAPGEGPFAEDWGWIILRFEENGEPVDYYAQRTGPVTARILENAYPRHLQHVRDEIVFDAAPLYEPPEDEEERKAFIATFRALHILAFGGYGPSWQVEGAHPGREAVEALDEALEGAGHQVWFINTQYTLKDSAAQVEAEAERPGLLFSVASPQGVPPLELHTLLETLTRDWPEGLCWLDLARQCGAQTNRHRAIMERFDL